MARHGSHGPALQLAMFADGQAPPEDLVEDISHRARTAFAHRSGSA